MYNEPNAWSGFDEDHDSQEHLRKTLLTSRDCHSIDDLIRWICDDAQYQSSQYINETKADCEGE
jgi:hypothetical protein